MAAIGSRNATSSITTKLDGVSNARSRGEKTQTSNALNKRTDSISDT